MRRGKGQRKRAANADPPAPPPARAHTSYWAATKTPIHSLLFVLPMVAFYEIGIVSVGRAHAAQVRNGGDVMLRRLVALVGRPGVAASALLMVAVLLLWQALGKHSWRVRLGVLVRMLPESAVLAGGLYGYARLHGRLALQVGAEADLPLVGRLALCFGNGVYEELVFRLLLVSVLTVLFSKGMGLERTRAVWWAVGIAALAFAVAHYVGGMGDVFTWHSFLFRLAAGLFFSVVLAFRGYGIAVGAHAFYDVAVVLLH